MMHVREFGHRSRRGFVGLCQASRMGLVLFGLFAYGIEVTVVEGRRREEICVLVELCKGSKK